MITIDATTVTFYKTPKVVKKSSFDHEAGQEVNSASNLEFSRAFRCSRTPMYAALLSP